MCLITSLFKANMPVQMCVSIMLCNVYIKKDKFVGQKLEMTLVRRTTQDQDTLDLEPAFSSCHSVLKDILSK